MPKLGIKRVRFIHSRLKRKSALTFILHNEKYFIAPIFLLLKKNEISRKAVLNFKLYALFLPISFGM